MSGNTGAGQLLKLPLPSAASRALLAALAAICSLASPYAAGQPSATEVTAHPPPSWRDRFTPLQDPVRTEPQSLRRPLTVPLPPNLLATPAAAAGGLDASASSFELLPPGAVSTGWACATRGTAGVDDHPQWALQTLRESQPTAPPAAVPGPPVSDLPLLTLPLAVHLAMCHNPQVRATWSAIAQQAAQVGQAQSAFWPQVSAGIGRQRSHLSYSGDGVPSHVTQATTQNILFNWRLWDFGARTARTNAALAQLQATLHTQQASIYKALAEALQTYGDAQAAQARLDTQRALLPLAERSVQSAQRREQRGAGSGNDTLQAQTTQARIQLEQSRAQGDIDKARSQLTYLLGLPAGTLYQLEPIDPGAVAPVSAPSASSLTTPVLANKPASAVASTLDFVSTSTAETLLAESIDGWLQDARQYHPSIQAAKAQWEAAQASLAAVQSDGLPTIDLNLAHYRNGRPTLPVTENRSRENVVGVTLSVPLFDGFATTYKVRAAQALVEQKAIEYQATQQQTLQELVQLHAEAKATLQNLRMARSLYATATAAAQSTQRQFDKGAADILQLNQSLTSLQQAQLEQAKSQAEWGRARLRLWLYGASAGVTPAGR